MEFKRKKISRVLLDEMAKTMSVIPMSELMLMIGEYGPGYYTVDNQNSLNSWLSVHVMDIQNYREAVFYAYNDGTFGILIYPQNTATFGIVEWHKHPVTGQNSFSGKYFNAWGHTHINSFYPTIGVDDSTKIKIGLPTSIYYQCLYYDF